VEADGSRPHGTAPYFSPGLAAGRAEDTRCDIYAFGATLYEMLAGRPPYAGATVDAILAQIRRGPPPPILEVHPEAPPELAAVADGAMARELRDRYASMEDVLADLRRIEAGRSAHGPRHRARSARAGFDGSGWRAAPWLIAAVAAAILAALVGIVAWHLLGGPPSRPALDRLRRPPAGAPPVVPAPWRARP
jgi:hypothetical protein